MSNWKIIVGSLLAFVAVFTVGGSTLDDPQARPGTPGEAIAAAAVFLSVMILHWLLWRFIIPSRSNAPAEVTSFLPRRSRRGFLAGTIAFGYFQVAIYCLFRSGYMEVTDPTGRRGFLVMGLCLIGLGIAARLREAFSAISTSHERLGEG